MTKNKRWLVAFFSILSLIAIFLTLLVSLTHSTILKIFEVKTVPSDWHEVYNGYGSVTYSQSQGILIEPKTASAPLETHSGLLLAKITEQKPLKDFMALIQVSTEEQLRIPNPNPWEVFWLFFNHSFDSKQDSVTNYLTIKPNGIELGKAYNRVKQVVMLTQSFPTLTIGKIYTLTLIKIGTHVDLLMDGNPVLNYSAVSGGETLFNNPGAIGLYTEDARVHIYKIEIVPLNVI